jgi:mannose-binding lectin 1
VKSFVVHKLKEGKKVVHDHGTGYKPDWHDYADEGEQWKHDAKDVLREHGVKGTLGGSAAQQDITPVQAPLQGQSMRLSNDGDWQWTSQSEQFKDSEASQYQTEGDRFEDLHDRVTLLNHQMDLLYNDLSLWKKQLEKQQNEVITLLHTISEKKHDEVMRLLQTLSGDTNNAKHTIETVEKELAAVKNDFETGNVRGLLNQLHWVVNDNHLSMTEGTSHKLVFFGIWN